MLCLSLSVGGLQGDVFIHFSNGDVKHTFAAGHVRYFYAEVEHHSPPYN